MKPFQGAVDVAWCDGKTHLAQFKPHIAEVFCGPQRLHRGELLAFGDCALPSGRAVPELLFGKHSGDQEHAKRRPDCKLRAYWKIEARHRQVTRSRNTIKGAG